ncbi:hypothetical protein M378DRAFT_168127 [Amanita muscaria Koide BX008]|uniref:Uncharacterized protein n=1 Tax=Amanita muscaria (strain Koide BX008) TaxID=946122 RepID=A0A0C2WUE6_AMAMK|nr:hypothetical protein M378DRAFT_168127 [Amanita muscaria Koide BX008]
MVGKYATKSICGLGRFADDASSFLIDRNYSFSRSNNSFQTLVTFLDKSENSFTFEDAPFDPSIKTRTITVDGK